MLSAQDILLSVFSLFALYEDYIFLALTLMIACSVALGVKRIFVEGNDFR